MEVLALMKLKESITPEDVAKHGAEEVKHTLEAYLDGKIRSFWFRSDCPGTVFMLESSDVDEAREIMNELPIVVAGIAEYDLIPLQSLKPLGTLIGRNMMG